MNLVGTDRKRQTNTAAPEEELLKKKPKDAIQDTIQEGLEDPLSGPATSESPTLAANSETEAAGEPEDQAAQVTNKLREELEKE